MVDTIITVVKNDGTSARTVTQYTINSPSKIDELLDNLQPSDKVTMDGGMLAGFISTGGKITEQLFRVVSALVTRGRLVPSDLPLLVDKGILQSVVGDLLEAALIEQAKRDNADFTE